MVHFLKCVINTTRVWKSMSDKTKKGQIKKENGKNRLSFLKISGIRVNKLYKYLPKSLTTPYHKILLVKTYFLPVQL